MLTNAINKMTLEEAIQTKFKDEHQKAMLNVIYTGNWMVYSHAKVLKPFGLTPAQYNVMRILRGSRKKMTMSDIKSRMLDKTPNLTRLSDRLIEKGLVDRTRCDVDRRVVYLSINHDGLSLLTDIDKTWLRNKQVENALSIKEAETLNMLLDKMRTVE